jgi:copper(I)-binding protein
MRRLFALVAALILPVFVAGCAAPVVTSSSAAIAKARLTVEGPWVRATTGTKDASMTAAFLTVVNPGEADVKLTSADCADAGMVQLHEMVMQETKEGIAIPAGSHAHLTPGGFHIMLMMLKHELDVGDQVTITLHFSDGGSLVVEAPVKDAVEEEDHYHSPPPTAAASS